MKILRISTVPISLNILLKGQLRFLSQHFEVVAVSGSGRDLEELQNREGVRTEVVEMQRQISPLKDAVSLWQLYRLFRKEKPAVVHTITPKAGLLGMMAARAARVPVRMHTFTGLIFPSRNGKMQKLLIAMDRLLCRCATHIYPEGQGVKKDLELFRITEKPLKILANGNVNGIDLDWYCQDRISSEQRDALRQTLGIGAQDFVFVFIGRLVADKGMNELIAAFLNLQRRNTANCHPSSLQPLQTTELTHQQTNTPAPHLRSHHTLVPRLKLLLVGPLEQDLDPLLPETLHEIESNPGIIAVGWQQDVRPYFAVSDALVFPSYREGFPNVVMQAGAMELPAVVTDISGSNEIISEGINGTIVPVKDAAALEQAMYRIAADSGYYVRLKSQARTMIATRYEQSMVWNALLEEYRSVLSR